MALEDVVAAGRERALGVLAARQKILQAKAKAAGPSGLLVAEGDSWFDYPSHDVLTVLEDRYSYEIASVAHRGDAVEEMAYGDNQIYKLQRELEKLAGRKEVPKAILLSGGGNDIAGDQFYMFLNHVRATNLAHHNSGVVDGVIDERLLDAYIYILSTIKTFCQQLFDRVIPVLVHGYAYPVADGRGYMGGWWLLPGPWLAPGFRTKGYKLDADREVVMRLLMDRFNDMLGRIPGLQGFDHVRYLDLRQILDTNSWANELHPTEAGFEAVAAEFHNAITKLP